MAVAFRGLAMPGANSLIDCMPPRLSPHLPPPLPLGPGSPPASSVNVEAEPVPAQLICTEAGGESRAQPRGFYYCFEAHPQGIGWALGGRRRGHVRDAAQAGTQGWGTLVLWHQLSLPPHTPLFPPPSTAPVSSPTGGKERHSAHAQWPHELPPPHPPLPAAGQSFVKETKIRAYSPVDSCRKCDQMTVYLTEH